jgi:energy-coupling factor transporter ATP-binding protein EcfA2
MKRLITTLVILGAGIPLMLWALDNALTTLSKYGIVKVKPLTIQINPEIIAGAVSLMLLATTTTIMVVAVIRSRRLLGIIPLQELRRHMVLLGPTGSGKTTVAKAIIAKTLEKSPATTVIIDWKGEYTNFLSNASIIRKVDIWDAPGDSPREKALVAIEMLREISRDIVEMSPPSTLLLLRILEEEYKRGVPKTERVISLLERNAALAQKEGRVTESNMYLALIRRLYLLLIDEERSVENEANDSQVIIFDLSLLPSVYLKILYSVYVIWKVYKEAIRRFSGADSLKLLLLTEEVQNYIRPRRAEELPTVAERLIYEIRSFGVGVILVCPDPELLPTAVLKDVGAVISMSPDTLPRFALERFLFRASLEEAEDTLKKLKKARMVVYYKNRLHFLRRLPRPPKTLKLKAGPKGDRMGVVDSGVGLLRAWPIPHRSPGRPTPKVEEGPKVIEVKEEPKPKVVEVVEKSAAGEELRLEEEEPESEVEEPQLSASQPRTQIVEEHEKPEVTGIKETTGERTVKPEPAPKGPPVPSALPYRESRAALPSRALRHIRTGSSFRRG